MAKVPDDGRVTEKLKNTQHHHHHHHHHCYLLLLPSNIHVLQQRYSLESKKMGEGGGGERKGERGGRQSRTIYLKNRDWNCAAVILMII
jgi:hypothetical protein